MISIEDIYVRVKELSSKDFSGYMSSDEFNNDIRNVQDILMTYYVELYEKDNVISEAIEPFVVSKILMLNDSKVDLPSDYRYKISVGYITSTTQKGGTKFYAPVLYVKEAVEFMTRTSPIRKSDISKGRGKFTITGNEIIVLEDGLRGKLGFKYIKTPPQALRGYIVNQTTQQEDYDPSTSTDLVWPSQEETNIIDLMLLMKGIQVRETALINWAVQKKNFTTPIKQY